MIIYFVRHGETENPNDIVYGRLPGFPLSEEGRAATVVMARAVFAGREGAEAAKVAATVVAAIYYSPLQRTQETAQLIRDSMHVKPPLFADDRLLEAESIFVSGPAERLRQSGRKEDLVGWFKRCVPEPVTEIQRRVLSLVAEVRGLYPGRAVVLVSHADTIGPALCALLNEPMPKQITRHIRKCSVHEVSLNGETKYRVRYEGGVKAR